MRTGDCSDRAARRQSYKDRGERYANTVSLGLRELENAFMVDHHGNVCTFRDWKEHYVIHGTETSNAHPPYLTRSYPLGTEPFDLPPKRVRWIMGENLFELHDTFGLRPDFVAEIVSKLWLGSRFGGLRSRNAEAAGAGTFSPRAGLPRLLY